MPKRLDLTGQVFGRLTAIRRIEKSEPSKWLCQCQCGAIKEVQVSKLTLKKTQSCGCLHKELLSAMSSKHKMSNSSEYRIWAGMKRRCHSPVCHKYEHYGGRGITVCDRWLNSFERFYEDMGPRPSPRHSIDRIDVNGHYEPRNCRWATTTEQRRNTRVNAVIHYLGRDMCIAEAAELSGFRPSTLYNRLRRGWSNEDLFLSVKRPKTSTASPLSN